MPDSTDNQIKLYVALIDQLHKYSAVTWQFPLALFGANSLLFNYLRDIPGVLVTASVFNAALLFAFARMVTQQKCIIDAARRAEQELGAAFSAFIPQFKRSRLGAPSLILWVLVSLDLLMLAWGVRAWK